MMRPILLLLGALVLAACGTTTPAPTIVASGEVFFLEPIALPPNAVVQVELRDVSRADAAARVLATQTIRGANGPPYAFSLSAPASDVDPRASLTVSAAIRDGERLLFITDTHNPVPREGASEMRTRMVIVPASPSSAPVAYRCGEETFRVLFEDERALVTLPDNSSVTLERLTSAAPARTFTNGRLTFVLEAPSMDGPRILFARGRMAPAPCEQAATP